MSNAIYICNCCGYITKHLPLVNGKCPICGSTNVEHLK